MTRYRISGENHFGRWAIYRPTLRMAEIAAGASRNLKGNQNVKVKEITK